MRLAFTARHPVLSSDAQVVLTLRLPGGLSTDEIGRAFPESGALGSFARTAAGTDWSRIAAMYRCGEATRP